MTQHEGMVEHHAAITVNATANQVYALFSHFNDFPKFMSFVKEVTYYDNQNSHWVADIVGHHEWDATNEQWIQNQQIGWRSTKGLENAGRVTFQPSGANQTRVDVYISYNPPAGILGDIGENLGLGKRFDTALQEDLAHFARMVDQAPPGALDPMASNYLFRHGSAASTGTTTDRQDSTMETGTTPETRTTSPGTSAITDTSNYPPHDSASTNAGAGTTASTTNYTTGSGTTVETGGVIRNEAPGTPGSVPAQGGSSTTDPGTIYPKDSSSSMGKDYANTPDAAPGQPVLDRDIIAEPEPARVNPSPTPDAGNLPPQENNQSS